MTTFKNHFAILKVGEHASSDEIKAAYKVQCLRWHPDLNPGVNTTSIMQALNEAKEILLDPVKREQYNLEYAQYKKPKANQTIAAKAASPTTNKVSDFLTWWITWVILAALFRAISH